MEHKNQIYNLITSKLSDEISESDEKLLTEELLKDGDLVENFTTIQKFWNQFYPNTVSHKIIEKTEKKLELTDRVELRYRFITRCAAAATLLLVVMFSVMGYFFTRQKPEVMLTEYKSKQNEIKEFVLSDGTKVWLNNSSVLITSQPFLDNIREVLLIGEGYFEVAHDVEKPFIIKTPALQTKVLGTHVNVRAYQGNNNVEVSLYEGKVELYDTEKPSSAIAMKPGEKTIFSVKDRSVYIKSIKYEKEAVWRDGIIRFYDDDMYTIAQKLENKFDTRIIIANDEVGKLRYTGNFEKETLDQILKLLSEAQKFSLIKTDNGIIIRKS
ncbi:MAG TPA: hypothetical protein DER09_13215 [Prolixibacteraceae bacterium]|nr:hypothetical protein [Prolixibacteraceae bacterium]